MIKIKKDGAFKTISSGTAPITQTISSISTATEVPSAKAVLDYVMEKLFPVGCIYTTATDTNPYTILGFGTWEKISDGHYIPTTDKLNIVGNGISLGLTDGVHFGGGTAHESGDVAQAAMKIFGGAYNKTLGNNGYYGTHFTGGWVVGVPTEELLGNNISASGLITSTKSYNGTELIDNFTKVYMWKRTA